MTLNRLLTRGQVARRLELSAQRIDQFVKDGRLPCTQTPYGRLFDPADVERLAAERAERQRPTAPTAA